VRVLRLTNSNDVNSAVAGAANKASIGERMLAEAAGEPVETTIRTIWPSSELPQLIAQWVRRYEPDLVLFVVSSYWFTYESIPTKVEHSLGPVGPSLARLGIRAAGNNRLANNRLFRAGRGALLNTIGGVPFFTTDEVNQMVEECLRAVVGFEGVGVVARGPRISYAAEGTRKAKRRAEARRLAVHRHVSELCRRLHVEYIGWDSAVTAQEDSSGLQGDLVHMNESLHAEQGRIEGEAMLRAWRANRTGG
jgi:hypothetical protein